MVFFSKITRNIGVALVYPMFLCALCVIFFNPLQGQNPSTDQLDVRPYAYLDTYYSFSINQPPQSSQPYMTQMHRHNEVNVNWAYLGLEAQSASFRSKLALQGGTYVDRNQGHEPGFLRYIREAYVGIQLYEDLWLDMGVMPTHIGIEYPEPMPNWNFQRLWASDAQPYYQTGAHLSYQADSNWFFLLAVLNGFQSIEDNNDYLAAGMQAKYTEGKWTLSYSNIITPEDRGLGFPNGLQGAFTTLVWLNDFYAIYELSESSSLALSADFTLMEHMEYEFVNADSLLVPPPTQETIDQSGLTNWWDLALLYRWQFHPEWYFSGSVEFFQEENNYFFDRKGAAAAQLGGTDFFNGIAGLHYQPNPYVRFHLESRYYHASHKLWLRNTSGAQFAVREALSFTTGLSASF